MKKAFFSFLALIASLAATQTMAQQVLPAPTVGRAPGLYVAVLDGLIHVTNQGGSTNFSAGQFGFTASPVQPPVMVPKNPAIQFTPPPAFNSSSTPSANGAPSKSNSVDCEVR